MNLGCIFELRSSAVCYGKLRSELLCRWTRQVGYFVLLVGCCLGWSTQGAVPHNDRCSDAEVIPSSGPFPYLTLVTLIDDATTINDPPKPTCQSNVTRSVWYRFTPANTGLYSISTCEDPSMGTNATTVTDTVLAVYRGECGGPYTFVDCLDDSCDLQATMLVQMTSGVRYFIVVWQYEEDLPDAGFIQLRIDHLRPPPNSTCSTALPLTLNIPQPGTTILGLNNYQLGAADCLTGVVQLASTAAGPEVVYSFTAPTNDIYSFRISDYEVGNLVLYASESCPGGSGVLTINCLAAANRSTPSSAEEIFCLPLLAAQKIYLFVDDHTNGSGSTFTIQVTTCTPEQEPNDEMATASSLLCEVTGEITSENDNDFYSLGSPGAGSRIFALVDGEAANITDFELRITTETDVVEYDDNDNDLAFGNRSPNVAGTPWVGGRAYVLVNYRSFAGFVAATPYKFYCVVQPPLAFATLEVEPNDLSSQASQALNNYFRGQLPSAADRDLFAVVANAGEMIYAALDADPLRNNTPIDAELSLLDASGNVLRKVDDGNIDSSTNSTPFFMEALAPRSPAEALIHRVPTNGTYYVQVAISPFATDEPASGDYLLSVTRNCVIGRTGRHEGAHFRSIKRTSDQEVLLRLQGTPGTSYRIESSGDLSGWDTIGIASADVNGFFQMNHQISSPNMTRFYRAVWP